jgi:broad specificity phosphatase PhoE
VKIRWSSGPAAITLVRHGQSLGNEADTKARDAGAEQLDLDQRDADVELSETGLAQADGLAKWLSGQAESSLPTVVISSPYRRAADTASRALAQTDLTPQFDERLRERDLGVFDGLTGVGIRARHPDEAERRKKVGKFYYQPPSGESWSDVVLRVRSLLDDLRYGYDGTRVWLFTHQAVIMSFRYVLEGLSEDQILELDRTVDIPNASMTSYVRDGDELVLDTFADTSAVDEVDAEVTHESSQGAPEDEH